MEELVGRTLKKKFKGFGMFSGTVRSYDSSNGFFKVVYEDGDTEDLELSEITPLLDGNVATKRRRFGDDSGTRSLNIVGESCSHNEILRNNLVVQEGFVETLGNVSKEIVAVNLNEGFNLNEDLNLNDGVLLDLNHAVNLNDGDKLTLNNEVRVNNGLDLNDDVDGTDDDEVNLDGKRNEVIDLNLVVNEDDDIGDKLNLVVNEDDDIGDNLNLNLRRDDLVGGTQKREHCFDLNLDAECEGGEVKESSTSYKIDEETQKMEIRGDVETSQIIGGSSGNGTFEGVQVGIVEGTSVNGFSGYAEDVSGDAIKKEAGSLKRDGTCTVLDASFVNDGGSSEIAFKGLSDADAREIDGYQENLGSTSKGRSGVKRRKLSGSVKSTPATVLRRSTRRGRASFLAQDHVSSAVDSNKMDDPSPSPVGSAVSEEKPTISGHDESEGCSVLTPKLQLPPSSENLNLEGIPLLDLFSVYSFLRSFSTLLFLSPFKLEEFVASVKCKNPNLLFDHVHVSLLRTLRKNLDSLSDDSLQSAYNHHRGLNWDLLDLITWPIFMVEYLLMHGSGFNLGQLRLFGSDYYRQPASIKLEMLRYLCDDVIEVEAIRSELNRRTLAVESNMDFDQNTKFESSRKSRAVMDVSGGSCLAPEEVDETTDWNSDECFLCKMDGNLLCCDGCPAAFHSRCVGVASALLPEGDWYCPECVIDKDKPWMKVRKSIRGAELLGIDPYGRLYYSSCGYLLVSDSHDTECSFNYYHKNDIPVVIEALKSSDAAPLHSTILSAILKHWDVYKKVNGAKSDFDSKNVTACSDFLVNGPSPANPMPSLLLEPSEICVKDEIVNVQKPEEKSLTSMSPCIIGCEVSEFIHFSPMNVNHSMKMEILLASSQGSGEISQAVTGIQNLEKNKLNCRNVSAGLSNDAEVPGKLVSVDSSLTFSNIEVGQGKIIQPAHHGRIASTRRRGDVSQGQCGTSYMNYYSFARTASLVAEELSRKSSAKIPDKTARSIEEIISGQLKAILIKSTEFCWPNIKNLNVDARKEKCGWCFSCKFPDDERDCLFIMNSGPILENFTSEVLGLRSRKNRKGHLIDVMCYILCIEDRLHGLLLGPWLNPHYSNLWHKSVLRSSDIASVKHLLLMLESNLHHLAFSAEWVKHVDSVAKMGSASHVVTNSLRMSSKHGISRKRARRSELVSNPSSNSAAGLSLFWWRGGRLSRQLFNWKVLPGSSASKAARQAGSKKIPGILYPDGSEFAKRSKYVAWRAAVGTSVTVDQLALRVRELDANIRWVEIEKTNVLSEMDKEAKKSIRSFKKVVVRRKCSEGVVVKYLLDFGKRRFIPDIVMKHGSMLGESSSGRKRYWLEESHVPLHILKLFEEKRIARKSTKSSGKLNDGGRLTKKPCKRKGFSYLFSKAERSENYQCGHCNKDVSIREAVICEFCKGFFHKRHVKKSSGSITAECTYKCHKCQDGKCVKMNTKKRKSQLQKSKKSSEVSRTLSSKISKKCHKEKLQAQSQNSSKDSMVVPLRRSARNVKCLSLQNKKIGRRKKNKHTKSRKGKSRKTKEDTWKKKRTEVYHTYWLNGLLLSRKANDERVMHFRSKKLIVSSEHLNATLDQPKCSVCCETAFTSTLNYIGCDICGDWFHGDAFGLRADNIGNVIGFKCHKCRDRNPPECPHLHLMRSAVAQLGGFENEAGTECAEEVSDVITLPNMVVVEQKSCSDEESKDLFLTDESSHIQQQSEAVPDMDQDLELDLENGQLSFSFVPKQEAIHNSNEKDWRRQDILTDTNENTLSENNASQLGDVNGTTLIETEFPFSKSETNPN